MVLVPDPYYLSIMVLTLWDYGVIVILTTLTGLLSAYIVYRVIKPRLQATIRGYIPVVTKSIKRSMGEIAAEAAENFDLSSITGGGEGEGNPLGALSGLLGGGSGGIGDLLGLLGQFTGKQTTKGKGKMGL